MSAVSRRPRVYVSITSYNGWADTLECLESLLRSDYPNLCVVVCDNGSVDGTQEKMREWAAGRLAAHVPEDERLRGFVHPPLPKPLPMIVHDRATAEAGGGPEDEGARLVLVDVGSNRGFSGGTNVGLRYGLARGDLGFGLLLNNDTVVHPGAVSALVDAAEANPRWGMVGGKLLYYDEPGTVQAAGGGELSRWNACTRLHGGGEPDDGRWDAPMEPEAYVHGACLLARGEALREVGLIDEAFFIYSEEVDWCLRFRAAGWGLGYAPAARVWHKEGRGIGFKSPMQDYHGVRGRLMLLRKHYPAFLPLGFVHSVYQSLLPKVVRRQPDRLKAVLRAYRDFFRPPPPPGTNPWTAWERGRR